MLFIEVVLPVLLIVLTGYILQKCAPLDFAPLTTVSLYVLSPALVFSAVINQPGQGLLAGQIIVFMMLYTGLLLMLGFIVSRSLKFGLDESRSFYLTTAMMNVGNFGLPLAWFAFGDAGLNISVMTFVIFNIPLGTLAIVIAQGKATALREAIINMLRIPIFHAVILAFLLRAAEIQVPEFIMRTTGLLGQGAIPLMLVLLGMQLAQTRVTANLGFLTASSTVRLVIAPVIAWLLATVLGIEGLARNVIVLQTSTPSAILPLLYSLRFNTRPDLVASCIVVSTVLSALTLTVLLYLLP